jgi:hypothetical protein
MKSVLLGAVIFLVIAAGASAKQRHCIFRVHSEANANDGSVFATPLRSPFSGKAVFIEKTPWIVEQDVKFFYPYRAEDGSYGALLELDDHGRTILDTLSLEHRGSFLLVFLNGRPVSELQVDRRVSDGRIYLRSGLNEEDIKLMNKDWKLIGGRKK